MARWIGRRVEHHGGPCARPIRRRWNRSGALARLIGMLSDLLAPSRRCDHAAAGARSRIQQASRAAAARFRHAGGGAAAASTSPMTGPSPTGPACERRCGGTASHAAASGLTAAWWHGLTQFAPGIAEVTVAAEQPWPASRRNARQAARLSGLDVAEVHGLRVTSAAAHRRRSRCAARGRGHAAGQRAAAAYRSAHACGERTSATRAAPARRGPGAYSGSLRRSALRSRTAAAHDLLRAADITGWKANFAVGGYRVDVGFPRREACDLEADGFAFHSGADEFQIDRERQNAITSARLAGAALHLAGPQRVPGARRRGCSAERFRRGKAPCASLRAPDPQALQKRWFV